MRYVSEMLKTQQKPDNKWVVTLYYACGVGEEQVYSKFWFDRKEEADQLIEVILHIKACLGP